MVEVEEGERGGWEGVSRVVGSRGAIVVHMVVTWCLMGVTGGHIWPLKVFH